MVMRAENEFVLVGINAGAYGADDALVAANAKPVYDIDYNPEIKTEQIKEALGFSGAALEQAVEVYQAIKFKCLLRPSGTADLETSNDEFWRLCGVAPTKTATTDISYSLIDSSFEHGTIYYYVGDVLHKMTGVRGEVNFVHNIGAMSYCEYTFYGLDAVVAEAAAPVVDWSALTSMIANTASTISTMTLLGQAVDYTTLSINPGNKFSYLHVSGNESIEFDSRAGTFDIKIVEPKPSVINFWEKVKKGEQGALAFQRGTDVTDKGKIFQQDIANVQINGVNRSKDAGRLFISIKGNIKPLTRNSDITWKTR